MIDADLVLLLNLIHGSQTFVLSEDDALTQLPAVPPESGMTMIAGITAAAAGVRIESVFEVEADGGELFGVYWLIDGQWFSSSDEGAAAALGLDRAEIFPFGWELAVPLEVDHYRDPPPSRRPKLP